jgi:hypothetical protein
MGLNFKFLSDNEIVEPYNGASWWFVTREYVSEYDNEIVGGEYRGIHEFLDQFPPNYVAAVISIQGPNGILHDVHNQGVEWGFDILSDMMTINWVRFINE